MEENQLYILVVDHAGRNTEMIAKKKPSDVLQYATSMNENTRIQRIFSVNKDMETCEYQIIFDGQLKLV